MQKFELNEFKALDLKGHVIVDTRKPEIFCDGYINGSISIPFDDNFLPSLHELVTEESKILLIGEDHEVVELLKMVKGSGTHTAVGYLAGGFDAWKNAGGKFDMIIAIDTDEFAIDYQFDEFYLLDVRSKDEFQKEHVEDAENIPLIDLEQLIVELETADSYYVYGNTMAEAVTAGSLFKRNGFQRIRPVMADYETIKASGIAMFAAKKEKDKPRFPGMDPR